MSRHDSGGGEGDQAMHDDGGLRRFLASLDSWVPPAIELWLGCIILVGSASFWISADAGPIWDLEHWPTNLGAILGPLLVYRAWKRKPGEVKCSGCGDRVPIVTVEDKRGRSYLLIDCPDCGLHVSPETSEIEPTELKDSEVARRLVRAANAQRVIIEWHRKQLEAENERDE